MSLISLYVDSLTFNRWIVDVIGFLLRLIDRQAGRVQAGRARYDARLHVAKFILSILS